jgi:hypothetical protein
MTLYQLHMIPVLLPVFSFLPLTTGSRRARYFRNNFLTEGGF